MKDLRIGTAHWAVPKAMHNRFPREGSHLEQYAARFNAVEINSTFYRLPRTSTAARWAATVPADFRFAVKLSKAITHEHLLRNATKPLKAFADIMDALGGKAGPVLVQLPPKLAFSAAGEDFLHLLHEHDFPGVALEPRHASWFTQEVNAMLKRLHIARVAADPPRALGDGIPAGDQRLIYYRLHGKPRIYWSDYDGHELDRIAKEVDAHRKKGREAWVIFDNTAQGFATSNAFDLVDRVAH